MESMKRYVFSDSFHLIRVDGRPRTGEKISVFKQKTDTSGRGLGNTSFEYFLNIIP